MLVNISIAAANQSRKIIMKETSSRYTRLIKMIKNHWGEFSHSAAISRSSPAGDFFREKSERCIYNKNVSLRDDSNKTQREKWLEENASLADCIGPRDPQWDELIWGSLATIYLCTKRKFSFITRWQRLLSIDREKSRRLRHRGFLPDNGLFVMKVNYNLPPKCLQPRESSVEEGVCPAAFLSGSNPIYKSEIL